MPTIINLVKHRCACVFGEYAEMHLLPLMESQLTLCCRRVVTVWDTYGMECRTSQIPYSRWNCRVDTEISSKILQPKGAKWQKFLNNAKKDSLFQFLCENFKQTPQRPIKYSATGPPMFYPCLCESTEKLIHVLYPTWNMPVIRNTTKPTWEQWTLVWSTLPSPTFMTCTSLSCGSPGLYTYKTFQSTWFLNIFAQNRTRPYHSPMPTISQFHKCGSP